MNIFINKATCENVLVPLEIEAETKISLVLTLTETLLFNSNKPMEIFKLQSKKNCHIKIRVWKRG